MNSHMTKSLVDRIRPGQPHTDTVVEVINKLATVGDMLKAHATKLDGDRNLTAIGRQSKLAERVRGDLAKEFAIASRPIRKALAYTKSERATLGLPKVDRTDTVGEMRRQETRAFLRGLAPRDRFTVAQQLAADPDQAAAIFDAPPVLSGLDDASLQMPHAEVYEQLRQADLEKRHGPRLADVTGIEGDYLTAQSMAGAVRHEIFKMSGLTPEGFEALMGPLEVEADR